MRNNRSDREPNTVFEQENFYYWCDVYEQMVSQDLDDYEREAEFVLRTVDIDEAIRTNAAYESSDFFDEIMIKRELRVLEMIKEMQEGS